MPQRPSPPPSPQARRQAHVLALRQALSERDRSSVDGLLGQWVHRHGVDALEPLLQELEAEDSEGLHWWRTPQAEPEPLVVEVQEEMAPEPQPEVEPEPVVMAEPEPVVAPVPIPQSAFKPVVRRRAAASRPAPAPSHPALAELRAWLPGSQDSRAA
ncbi:MAG: hypothetical protein WAO48_08815 [Vulcanococcus sp.]